MKPVTHSVRLNASRGDGQITYAVILKASVNSQITQMPWFSQLQWTARSHAMILTVSVNYPITQCHVPHSFSEQSDHMPCSSQFQWTVRSHAMILAASVNSQITHAIVLTVSMNSQIRSHCLLSITTAPLLIWLKNSTHSAHKDQNIWTSFFSHAAPSVWNSLPHDIRHIQSVTAFKTAFKTHLFKSYLC